MVSAYRIDSPPHGRSAAMARAFKRALLSQCHPAMLFAVLLPFLIALVGSILMMWLFWTPLTDWLRMELARWGAVNRVDDWLAAVGMFSLKLYLAPVIAAAMPWPSASGTPPG